MNELPDAVEVVVVGFGPVGVILARHSLALSTLVSPQLVRDAVRNHLIEVQQRARP